MTQQLESPETRAHGARMVPFRKRRGASADDVIGAEYAAYKDEVVSSARGKLAASQISFADIDMDSFYNQAWYGLYTKLQDGEEIENRKGLLVQMTYRRAIDEFRSLHPDRQADAALIDTLPVDDDFELTIDQQDQFRQFVEGMRSSLSEREMQAATLCWVYGMTRPEAAEQLGVRPKRMEKIMDEVSVKLRPLLAHIKAGEWCQSRAVLINQYALGALEEDSLEYREAVAHLANCSGCRRHVLGTRGMTAVAPPSGLLLLALTGALAAGAAGAAAAGASGGGAGAGVGVGGGAAAGGAGAGVGAAQAAAVIATVAAVGVGGFVAAKNISTGDEPPVRPTGNPPAAQSSARPAAKANAAKAKKAAAKRKARRAKAKVRAEQRASTPPPQAQTETAPQPEQRTSSPPQTPPPPVDDTGEEFDLR